MNKGFFLKLSAASLLALTLLQSCDKDDDKEPTPEPIADQSFSQSFDSQAAATTQGWVFKNLSDDADGGWAVATRGYTDNYSPFSGAGLLVADYTASGSDLADFPDATISNWAISPKLMLQNGDKISFYARSHGDVGYFDPVAGEQVYFPDRIQLRLSTLTDSDSIGTGPTDLGGFTTSLIDINPLFTTAPGFPSTWTKFEATVSGLNKPVSGRFAIRYFVPLDGGAHGDEVVIDQVEYKSVGH